jgi:hypothetical protein
MTARASSSTDTPMTKWLWRDRDALFSEWLILPATALVYMRWP